MDTGQAAPDVFVSYAHRDRATAEKLVKSLKEEGWSVWWDTEIAGGQELDVCVRDRAPVEIGVCRWCGCIVEAVVNVHGAVEPHGDLTGRLKVVPAPAAFTNEWRRHQEERAKLSLRRLLREDVDQYRTSDRMANEDGVVIAAKWPQK